MTQDDSIRIRERLDRLEAQNRRLRRGFALALLCLGALLLPQCTGGEVVTARLFVAEDGEGRRRATFGIDEEGVRLRLYDDRGMRRAALSLGENGDPGLALFDAADRPQAVVEVTKTGPSFVLIDPTGKPVFQKP